MARKTFNVDAFRESMNAALTVSTCSADRRQGMMNALEFVLHDSGNYKGFKYLMMDQVPTGEMPGILVNSTGLIETTPPEERFPEGKVDRTRVHYF